MISKFLFILAISIVFTTSSFSQSVYKQGKRHSANRNVVKKASTGRRCGCVAGDPNIDVVIVEPLTPAQLDSLNLILRNKNNPEEPGVPLKDVAKYIGHEVYIRDSIFSYNHYDKSYTELYLGGTYPNHLLRIFIKGQKLNRQTAYLRKKGYARFTGKAVSYLGKPAIMVTSLKQLGRRVQL